VVVSTFGALFGLGGIEHGIGEMLQGNVAPSGVMIESWPGSAFYRTLAGEPALTVVPNLLAAGMLTVLVSLLFLVWSTLFVTRRHGGLVMIGLAVVMLLVGGGIGPPLIGILLGAVATRIGTPLPWWRAHLPPGLRRVLARLWPWLYGAGLVCWLAVLPGIPLLDYAAGVDGTAALPALIFAAFSLLLLMIVAAFARDIERAPQPAPERGEGAWPHPSWSATRLGTAPRKR
jgi:hypothetical protein